MMPKKESVNVGPLQSSGNPRKHSRHWPQHDRSRDHHVIPYLKTSHTGTNGLDDPSTFVTENQREQGNLAMTPDDMLVGRANTRRNHPNAHFARCRVKHIHGFQFRRLAELLKNERLCGYHLDSILEVFNSSPSFARSPVSPDSALGFPWRDARSPQRLPERPLASSLQ